MVGTLNTQRTLVAEMRDIGIEPGMTLMVHASLSKVGWIKGGAETVVRALFETLGPDGTLVMPAATPQLAPPGSGPHGLKPPAAFDIRSTPTAMGALAEAFRTWPGTYRSAHPLDSVCAHGPNAANVTSEHRHEFSEERGTPFEKLYDLDSFTLLLGVGFNRCTALHFAEFRSSHRRTMTHFLPTVVSDQLHWMAVPGMAYDNGTHFPVVGDFFAQTNTVCAGKIGQAHSAFFSTRALVDFAVPYFDTVLKPLP